MTSENSINIGTLYFLLCNKKSRCDFDDKLKVQIQTFIALDNGILKTT